MRTLLLATACCLLLGCATHFETGPLGDSKVLADGLVYYEARMYRVTYEFRSQVDPTTGNVISKPCKPVVQKDEVQFLPDFENPRYIVNKPASISASKFSVTLNNGILTALNSESTPQASQLIASLVKPIDATAFFTKVVGDACNAGPVISALRRCSKALDCVAAP